MGDVIKFPTHLRVAEPSENPDASWCRHRLRLQQIIDTHEESNANTAFERFLKKLAESEKKS